MKKLIINADDFGLTEGVCRGIVEAITKGLVCSTTAMVCMPLSAERVARWARLIPGKVGLHLQLTGEGEPCLPPEEIPSLVTAMGRFPRHPSQVRAEPGQAAREWRAQVARLRELGVEPNHLDSHHHIHQRPELFPVFMELALELGVPARNEEPRHDALLNASGVPHPRACLITWYGANTNLEGLLACLEKGFAQAGDGAVLELMCHPGLVDYELESLSTYCAPRQAELAVLTASRTAQALAAMGVELTDWSEVARQGK